MNPTIGRIVLYRSRTGQYTVPAIVTATRETLNPEGVEAGKIPPLSSDLHVHLTVFSPGKPGERVSADDFEAVSEHPVSENVSGCYQEWDIAPSATTIVNAGEEGEHAAAVSLPASVSGEAGGIRHEPGTWAWPTIAASPVTPSFVMDDEDGIDDSPSNDEGAAEADTERRSEADRRLDDHYDAQMGADAEASGEQEG